MKAATKQKLEQALEMCEGKSFEYKMEFMQQHANVDYDCVFNFLVKKGLIREMKVEIND